MSEIKRVAHKGMDKEGGREGVRVEEREREWEGKIELLFEGIILKLEIL